MKRLIKFLMIFTFVIVVLAALTSCGESVTVVKSYVNDELHAIVEFSDGSIKDLGYVGTVDDSKTVTIKNSYINDEKHLIIEYSNGETTDYGYVGVVDESKNVTVVKSFVNDELHAIVEFSNGETKDLGYVGTVDESLKVTVLKSYVNDEFHAIVEFSDGSVKDLGYVGVEVEVEPPLYVVRFYSNEAKTKLLSEQEVYRGKSAKAPTAPSVTDKVFAGWSGDYENVQGNMDLYPIYTAAAEYTVTFKDELGNVLKTEKVIAGHSATAPNPPTREDTIFNYWDNSYSNIKSDMTITAIYRPKNNYTVTFQDFNGIVLGTVTVKEGNSVTAPTSPTRDGYTFSGWDSSLDRITSNKTIKAMYSLKAGNNIMDISYSVSGNKLTVTYAMKGTVKLCGMQGEVVVPAGLTFVSKVDGDGTTANFSDGKIYFMYASANGKDVTNNFTVMTITFTINGSPSDVTLATTIKDIYDQAYTTMTSSVIGQKIQLK